MKKLVVLLSTLICISSIWAQREGNIDVRNIRFPEIRMQDNIFTFESREEFTRVADYLEEIRKVNVQDIKEEELEEKCMSNPALNAFEERYKGYKSLRKKYEENECLMLSNLGIEADLTVIPKCPILEDGAATLFNEDGNIIIGDELFNYYSESIILRTKINNKEQLMEILRGNLDLLGTHGDTNFDGEVDNKDEVLDKEVIATPRGGSPCSGSASFKYQVNHSTGDVFLNYTGSTTPGIWKWGIPNTTNQFKNETYVQVSQLKPGDYDICVTYEERTDKKASPKGTNDSLICSFPYCQKITVGGCDANFDFSKGFDGNVQFTNLSTALTGTIDKWEWTFGDGKGKSTEWSPSYLYPCDKKFTVNLTIWSKSCPNGQISKSKTIEVTEKDCCDKNPDSGWKDETYEDKKKIKHKYDMGSLIIWDQRFVAKLENYEFRKGGWFDKEKWRFTKADMHADILGTLYNIDENDCYCVNPYTLNEKPDAAVYSSDHVFKDRLDGISARSKWARMKKDDPVFIDYKINGKVVLHFNCVTQAAGYKCE